jgi:hypothetical protein
MLFLTLRDDDGERSVRLDSEVVLLGSSTRCGLTLRADGVAPRHAVLRAVGYDYEIVDLGSAAGTLHCGLPVRCVRLRAGDGLRIGGAFLTVEEWALEFPVAPIRSRRIGVGGDHGSRPFNETLYLAMRQSPAWFLSGVAHVAAALLLLWMTPEEPPRQPLDARLAIFDRPAPSLQEESVTIASEGDPPPPPTGGIPETSLPLPLEALEDDDASDEGVAVDDGSRVLGIADTSLPPGFDTPRPRPPVAPRKKPERIQFEDDGEFDVEDATNVQETAAGLLERGLGGADGDGVRTLRAMDPRRLLVVRGAYDEAESLLRILGLKHEILEPADLLHGPIAPGSVLVFDCNNQMLDDDQAEAVRRFVEAGGFLCTTDWALSTVLERALPGFIRRPVSADGIPEEVADARVRFRIPYLSEPLVEGVPEAADDALWWIEENAHLVENLVGRKVRVLVESQELKRDHDHGILAVTFAYGKGHVLHLVGHLWQKKGNLRGAYAMQRLFTNFLLLRARTFETTPAKDAAQGLR